MKLRMISLLAVLTICVSGAAAAERYRILDQEFLLRSGGIDRTPKAANLVSLGGRGAPEWQRDWREFEKRGLIPYSTTGYGGLLQNPVEETVKSWKDRDFDGNPAPVILIDEFGHGYDCAIDRKVAEVLRAMKEAVPHLRISVWQMRGAFGPIMAAAYRDAVDIVLMESYVATENIWLHAAQWKAAELHGLDHKSLLAPGLGVCPRDDVRWILTRDELEQHLLFIRMVAPKMGGLANWGSPESHYNEKNCPDLTADDVDELFKRFRDGKLPSDGTGLRPELVELAKIFTRRYEGPALVASGGWVQPNRTPGHVGSDGKWTDWGRIPRPVMFHTPILNMGETDAKGVIVRLRNPVREGERFSGEIFAQGVADLPARSVTVVRMPMITLPEGEDMYWVGWTGSWDLIVEAPEDAEVFNFDKVPTPQKYIK